MNKSFKHSINHSIIQSFNHQSIIQSSIINQSFNQSINKRTKKVSSSQHKNFSTKKRKKELMMEIVFDTIPTQFYVFLTFWSLAWITTKLKNPNNEGHFSANGALLSFSNITGMIMSAVSLYFNDEEIFMEANSLLWFASFFIVDLFDCLYRKDAIYTIHAIITLALCGVNCTPKFYNLRIASQGSFTEISSPYLWIWKNSKKKVDFQIFALLFFLCRIVWVPVFVTRASRIVDLGTAAYYVTGAFYLLQLIFFYKIVAMLLNYKEDKGKKEA